MTDERAPSRARCAPCGSTRPRRPGVYNIVDDKPAPVREWLPELRPDARRQAAVHDSRWLGRIAAGEHMVVMMTESRPA